MKKSARIAGQQIKDGQKDEDTGNLLYVSFPDDLFRPGVANLLIPCANVFHP